MDIDSKIQDQRLFIDSSYEDIAELFCNLAGAATSKTKKRFLLSNWYEGYLYCLMLGIKIDAREPYKKGKRADKAPKWSKYYVTQYKYAVSKLLIKKDIQYELNLTNRKSIKENFTDIDSLMDQIKKICDEYSNGGLLYLKNKFDSDAIIFNNHDGLIKIYNETKIK